MRIVLLIVDFEGNDGRTCGVGFLQQKNRKMLENAIGVIKD
jgi:hypothetical protein